MTLDETIDLLSVIGAFDRRALGEADAVAWHAAVGDLRFRDARQAVIDHYRESTTWIMPAHVRQGVKAIRDERLNRTPVPAPPRELLDDPQAYKRALLEATRRIADGEEPLRALEAS